MKAVLLEEARRMAVRKHGHIKIVLKFAAA